MRIVFEGADLTGKSTISKAIAEALKLPYRGRIVRVGPDKILQAQLEDFAKHPNAVLDRCYWLSNVVYEPITNHAPSALSSGNTLKHFLHEDDTLYILIVANEATLGKRMEERGDELQTLDTILEANKMYQRFMESRAPKHLIVHSTDEGTIEENIDKVLTMICEYLLIEKPKKVVKKEDKKDGNN